MKTTPLYGALACALVMTGCASQPHATTADTEAYASAMIAEKVGVAAEAQREYVALVAEDKVITERKQISIDTDEVDVDYIGSPQELLQTFAYRYGYRYLESGAYRKIQHINVRMTKSSPTEILRNIGQQIDKSGDLVLDKNAKTLRLIYKSVKAARRG